jgi:rhomboid protease GluP
MAVAWGYSPKIEKYIPLGDFPEDKYLVIVTRAIENLGWKISYVGKAGVIAYTPLSLQSYGEEISVRIINNFAVVKSECIGIQMLFNDYGKNEKNLEKFFHEFEYVEFHLQDVWDESLSNYHAYASLQDPHYFEKAPLTVKNRIKQFFQLFKPQENYQVTPILLILNVIFFGVKLFAIVFFIKQLLLNQNKGFGYQQMGYYLGANHRELVLNGQFWRLLSYQFNHGSFLHLLFNMYALSYIGLLVEPKLGSIKTFFVYVLAGVCGGLTSIVFHETQYIVGASGAIMGLFGAFLTLLACKAFERNATRALLISTLIVVSLMLLNGIRGNIDNAAHVGGLISGAIFTIVLYHQRLIKFSPALKYACLLAFIIAFGLLIKLNLPQYDLIEFKKLKQAYHRNLIDFAKINSVTKQDSKEIKIAVLSTNGIKVWQANDLVVKAMEKLNLNVEDRLEVEFHRKMVDRHQELMDLYYKQTIAKNPLTYNYSIRSLQIDINNVRLNYKGKTKMLY